jgi:hypothetical protein
MHCRFEQNKTLIVNQISRRNSKGVIAFILLFFASFWCIWLTSICRWKNIHMLFNGIGITA